MFSGRWNSKRLSKHWDKIAKDLDDFSGAPSTQYYRESEIGIIKEFLNPLRGKKLLKIDLWNEVNNTRILSWAVRQGARVYGIDISQYLVEKSKENFKKDKLPGVFIACDMRKLPFKDNYFDLVYTMGSIEHVFDYQYAVKEIYRVLKPAGKAIVGVPNRLDPFFRPIMVWILDLMGKYPYSPEQSFTRRELQMLLRWAGFRIKGGSGVLFMPGILRITDLIFYTRLKPLTAITNILLKPFEFMERKYSWARENAYLIASYVEKPKG